MRSNLIPITKIYDIYPKYIYSDDVKKFMDRIVDIDRVSAVRVPENGTNGDMIEAMFPKVPVGVSLDVDGDTGEMTFKISKDWWNSKYEEKC